MSARTHEVQRQTAAYLADLMALLWPDDGGASAERALVVLPNVRSPRLVVPREPRAVTAAAFRNYKASATGRSRALLRAGSYALRFGAADLLAGRISVPFGVDDLESHLADVLATEVRVAVHVGPRRAVQKPVLQVLSPSGSTLAYAKLGTSPLTHDLVRTEGQVLSRLAAAPRTVLEVPRVLHTGYWHGHPLLVQEAVTGTSLRQPTPLLVATAVHEVARVGGSFTQPWGSSGYRQALAAKVEGLRATPHHDVLSRALDVLDRQAADEPFRFGAWHGDWSPWNMAARGGRLVVWDWEHWSGCGPVGFDAIHHDLSRLLVQERCSSLEAVRRVLEGSGTVVTDHVASGRQRLLLLTAYLVEIAARYVEDGEDVVAGTSMSRLHEWLAPSLAHCANELGTGP